MTATGFMRTIVEVRGLKAYYSLLGQFSNREKRRWIRAVDNVFLEIYDNEILGIAGESGCGKSTLIRALYGAIEPPLNIVDGEIHYKLDGNEITINKEKSSLWRIKSMWGKFMVYLPQGSMHVLNPTKRIYEEFLDVLRTHIREYSDMSKDEILEAIEDYLSRLGLPVEVLKSYPHQLSGGMRQRTVIALSTILKPRIIFADEPTTALDVVNQAATLQLLEKIQQERKCSLVIVSHDMGVHAQICRRIAIMYAGKIVEVGPVNKIFEEPLHPYTRFLINSLPRIGDKSRRHGIGGAPPSLANPPNGCRFHPRCPYAREICKEKEPPLARVNTNHHVACHQVN